MSWSGIPRDRVVAVVATGGGWRRVSTGFLLGPRVVLTANHGLGVGDPAQAADVVRVVGASVAADVTSHTTADGLDVAVLELGTELVPTGLDPVRWGRVDRTASGRLLTAEAVGYPLWQQQATTGGPTLRDMAELRGVIRPLEGMGSGLMTIRDRDLETVNMPSAAKKRSRWGGLSGAAVFAESGHLIGVVVEHRPNDGKAALRILPVDRIAGTAAASRLTRLLGVPDFRDVPWAYPDPGHALARGHSSAVRQGPPEGLRARESELATLASRIEREPWTWLVADAFAGKTALLATLVADPPGGVAVASCFLRRREGLASAEYVLDTLTAQLAALTWGESFTAQAHGKAEFFDRMLRLAATACARRGDRLAVVIDGLDEYDPQSSVPLRAWLPLELPVGAALLVAGRPGSVPSSHPLTGERVPLGRFAGSSAAWEAARHELDQALRSPDPLAGLVATYLAATGGGLTEDELARLCSAAGLSVHAAQVAGLVDRLFDRTLDRTRSDGPVVFTHAAYRGALADILGPARLEQARVAVDEWVDPMRAAAWGAGTASYALRPYGRHLRARLDEARAAGDPAAAQVSARRLTEMVSSPHRWLALFRGEGTPVAGDVEVVESVQALLQAADAGLVDLPEGRVQASLVGLGRGLVRGRVSLVAGAVAHSWATNGRLDRATELAVAILEPDSRAYALAEAVGGAAQAGHDAATIEAAAQVAAAATEQAGPYRDPAKTALADALRGAGWFPAAGDVATALERPERRALALARIARDAAGAGQFSVARALAEQVGAIPVVNGNTEIFWAAAGVAEALTMCGDDEQAAAVLKRAGDAVDTGFGKGEWKYRSFANEILDVGLLRCRALEVSEDRTLAELEAVDREIQRLRVLISFTPLAAWRAGHLAAVWSRRAPTAARELAEHVVKGVLDGLGANWDGDSSWVGATPADVTGLFIDSGLLDAAASILDRDLETGDWPRHAGDLRARLVRALGRAGRLDDAERIAARIDEHARLGSLAWAGAACLTGCRDGTLLPYLAPRAQALVDDTFAAAAEAESELRLASVHGLITRRIEDTSNTPTTSASRPVWALEADLARLGETAAHTAESVDALAAFYLRQLRELGEVNLGAAAAYVDQAHALVATSFKALEERTIMPPLNAFRAAHDLTHVLLRLDRDGEAQDVATQMTTRLAPRFGALDFAACLADTLAALEAVHLLDSTEAARLLGLAWACRDATTWTWHGPAKLAVTLADAPPAAARHFSAAVADLVREDLTHSMNEAQDAGLRGWYGPALQALTSLLGNGLAQPAAEVARLLLDRGCDPSTSWYERGAILGGLVRAGEPSTCDEALARFLTEDAFADHVDCLPLDVLRRLAEELDLRDRASRRGTARGAGGLN